MTAMLDRLLAHTERPYLDKARARPFVKWAGGKRTLIPDIAQRLPPDGFNVYWEPFMGGGAVFFALDSQIGVAQLSDVNAELALTYQVVRNDPDGLISLLEQHTERHGKTYYKRVRGVRGKPTSLEVAARFIYLNKTCFNGLYRVNKKGQFNVPIGSYQNPKICDAENIRNASEVLSKAAIRFGDFQKIAPGSGDFVYADPPYDKTFTGYAKDGFNEDDQRRLRDAALRWHELGAFAMLSNADTPLINDLYNRPPFVRHQVQAPRTINCKGDGREKVGELLITTYG